MIGYWSDNSCRYCKERIGSYRTDWSHDYQDERRRRDRRSHYPICPAKATVDLRNHLLGEPEC